MTAAAAESSTSLRFFPRLLTSFMKPIAVTVEERSSHMRTSTPTSSFKRSANSLHFSERGPSVPFMFIGLPTTISSALFSRAASAVISRHLSKSFMLMVYSGEAST